jgi:RNA polymerase sigma-70 factor (ECF subfamily)
MSISQRNIDREQEIIRLLGLRDDRAVSMLYQHYSGALYGIIARMIPAKEVAEEVLQDTFVKIWDNAEKYDSAKGRLFTWLAQITRNAALDRVRSAGYRRNQKTDVLEPAVSNSVKMAEDMQIEDEGLRKVVAKMDGKYRMLIDYAYFQGYTQSEIAEELNMPLGTVKTRLRSAINGLRQILKNEIISILLLLSILSMIGL